MRKQVRTLLASLLLMLPMVVAASSLEGQWYELQSAGVTRSYKLFVPVNAGTAELPLMVVLHGGFGNADEMESNTGMDRVAATNQFMVAYPNGTAIRLLKNRRTWNAGHCCGRAAEEQVDDVQFIHRMLEDIASKQRLDRSRVYVTGMSNGAMLAYRLACDRPADFAAIIPVSGTLAVDSCAGAQGMPVLHVHGSNDHNVPYAGGMGEHSVAGVAHRSVPDTLQIIANAHGCNAFSKQDLPDGSQLTSWQCAGTAPLQLRLIPGGEHAWPGGESKRNSKLFAGNFSASQAAWDFAKQFQN
jgi:polyhydroxybutyrate depolymerase